MGVRLKHKCFLFLGVFKKLIVFKKEKETKSQQQRNMDFVPELTWGRLPEPALIAIFKNMAVTDLIRVAFQINKRWNELATSNEVWESKYKQLYYNLEIQTLLKIYREYGAEEMAIQLFRNMRPLSALSIGALEEELRFKAWPFLKKRKDPPIIILFISC